MVVRGLGLALAMFVLSSGLAFQALAQAQTDRLGDPKYGDTPEQREECLKNTSFYNEYYKQKNYRDAVPGWSIVYTICPRSSENIYIRGIRMIKMAIEQEKDPVQRATLVDSMLRIYDRKVLHFNRAGYNLGLKVIDLFSLDPSRHDAIASYAREAYKHDGDKVNSQAMLILMQVTRDMYANGQATADAVLETYSLVSELFSRQLAALPTGDALHGLKPKKRKEVEEEGMKLAQMSESLDALFAGAGVANCENLITIYTPKFEKDTANLGLAKNIRGQLAGLRCTDADLFLRTSEKVFRHEPSAAIGTEIARIYQAKRRPTEADRYFRAAVEAESDSARRSSLLVEYASFVGNTLGDMVRARSLALEALSHNPNQGYAYMLIGSLYGSTKNCGSSKIEKASAVWAAVDKFQQAKSVQPELADECNKQISYYSQFFPTSEEIFFQDYEVGKPFTAPCWINERTVIRAKN